MLGDVGTWEPDIEMLIETVAKGELGARVATAAGGRQALSEHAGPGSLSEAALNSLEQTAAKRGLVELAMPESDEPKVG